jgi:Erv1 / Alr family
MLSPVRVNTQRVGVNSQANLKSRLWGPPLWKSLHAISFGYPENPDTECRKRYYDFIYSLPHVLPCAACRAHFRGLLRNPKYRLDKKALRSRDSFSRWLVRAHNATNVKKRKACMPYKHVSSLYRQWVVPRKKNTVSHHNGR